MDFRIFKDQIDGFDAVIIKPTVLMTLHHHQINIPVFSFFFPKVDLEVSTTKRSPGCPIRTWFSLPPLAAAVLRNAPRPWTWWLGPGRRRGAAATCS